MQQMRIFIGYDEVESIAYHTLVQSIIDHCSIPVTITPLKLSHLRHLLDRPRDPRQSNEFAFSRFLVPYLCGYEGWAMFMDCDMLFRDDPANLWGLRDERFAVQVVKHDYVPRTHTKFLGNEQTRYRRKNWSSVMLFNCDRCRVLTPEFVNTAPGLELHRFEWLEDDEIGELPIEWNWLVGEYAYNPHAKNVHFTIGGPWFWEYSNAPYHTEWFVRNGRAMQANQASDRRENAAS